MFAIQICRHYLVDFDIYSAIKLIWQISYDMHMYQSDHALISSSSRCQGAKRFLSFILFLSPTCSGQTNLTQSHASWWNAQQFLIEKVNTQCGWTFLRVCVSVCKSVGRLTGALMAWINQGHMPNQFGVASKCGTVNVRQHPAVLRQMNSRTHTHTHTHTAIQRHTRTHAAGGGHSWSFQSA